MARQDIAGLLTGISSTQQPIQPIPGSANFRGQFGAARAQGIGAGLGRIARKGGPSRQEQIQGSMFELGSTTDKEGVAKTTQQRILDLTNLAQVQQMRGNPTGAMQSLTQVQQLQQQEKKETQEKQAGLRASSMATALEAAGHSDLAKQVKLGDTDAYKRGLELISPEKGKTAIEDIVDPSTGVTHKVVLSADGTVLRTVGVSKMPTLKSVTLPNGKLVWENEATGTRSEPQDTPEAAEQEKQRIEKLTSDLAAVDNVLLTVTEARELSKDPTGTGVLYNLASLGIETSARELAGKISTLQSTLAFDRLQKMRDESKTGGALGQVSNIELQLLQNSLTALDPIVGEEAFEQQLQKVEKHYNNFRKALLGQPIDIDWSQPAYKGKTTVVDGVRYMVDPTDPTKVFAIGKE